MNVRHLLLLLVSFSSVSLLSGADIVSVRPLTRHILLVHIDDGAVIHHKIGQSPSDDYVKANPLDIAKAMSLSSWNLSAKDDSFYLTPQKPVDIGRKSKGTEFAALCQSLENGHCVNEDPDHAKEHWIYLYLPSPLQTGKTYALQTGSIAGNGSAWIFVFNPAALRSDVIHVNQAGYLPDAGQKYAYLYHWMGAKGGLDLIEWKNRDFHVVDAKTQQKVFTGKIRFRSGKKQQETGQPNDTPDKNFIGADVYECDFSDLKKTGRYRLVVEGIGCSHEFYVSNTAYLEPFYHVTRSLYHNRSGIALEAPFTQFSRPAPHNPAATPGFAKRLKYSATRYFDLSNVESADKIRIENSAKGALALTWGWYQDAGDWDAYYEHSHIPAWLMALYESAPKKFTDGFFDLPESGNGLPDLLDEASWLLRFYRRAKNEILARQWGSGGVPGARVFADFWGGETPESGAASGSWQDTYRDWYVLGEDPWMSYKYAGLAAHFAFILEQNGMKDPDSIDWRQEATAAYDWAKNNTLPGDEAPRFDEQVLAHMRMYAAVNLFRLTKKETYHQDFLNDAQSRWPNPVNTLFNDDLLLSTYLYAALPLAVGEKKEKAYAASLINTSAVNDLLYTANQRACRWGGNFYFPMSSGQATTPYVGAGLLAYWLSEYQDKKLAEQYRAALSTTADYFLGCNPLNICWISGVGENSPTGIFHRDWWYGGQSAVLPGIVPYGPRRAQSAGSLKPQNPAWAHSTVYPNINLWPGHERWFNQRIAPLNCEFTIHQNTRLSALLYGALFQPADISSTPTAAHENAAGSEPALFTAFYSAGEKTIVVSNAKQANIETIDVFALSGQIIASSQAINRTNSNIRLPLPDIPAGIYIVSIQSAAGRQTLKLWAGGT